MVYFFLPLGLTILDPLDPVFFPLGRRRPAWSLPPCTVFVASSRLQRCAASENPPQRSSQQRLRVSENMNLWMILNAGKVKIKCFEKKLTVWLTNLSGPCRDPSHVRISGTFGIFVDVICGSQTSQPTLFWKIPGIVTGWYWEKSGMIFTQSLRKLGEDRWRRRPKFENVDESSKWWFEIVLPNCTFENYWWICI